MDPEYCYKEIEVLEKLYDGLKSNFPFSKWYAKGMNSIRNTKKATPGDKKYEIIYSLCDHLREEIGSISILIDIYNGVGRSFNKNEFYSSIDSTLSNLTELERESLKLENMI